MDAVEGAREELAIPEEDAMAPLPSPFEPFHLPLGTEGAMSGNQAAALDAEAEERTPDQQYRALSHSKLAAGMAALVDDFSDKADSVHRDALASYTMGRVPDIKSKAVLRIARMCATNVCSCSLT